MLNMYILPFRYVVQKISYCSRKNQHIWRENVIHFTKAVKQRKFIPLVEENLNERCKMPKELDILGQYYASPTQLKPAKSGVSLLQTNWNC